MISEFSIIDPKKIKVPPWMGKVKGLDVPRTFTFKPGLNIIFGRNGAGKSTLLQAMGQLLHCTQGGSSILTSDSMRDLNDVDPSAFKFVHDGQGAQFFDPSHTVGMFGGAFDDAFFSEGVANTMFKGSSGQTNLNKMNKILGSIAEAKLPALDKSRVIKGTNSYYKEKLVVLDKILEGTIPLGQPTVFLDEPDRSLDFDFTTRIWNFMHHFKNKVQFIVASHSFFAIRSYDAHFIELSDDYLAKCRSAIDYMMEPIEPKIKKEPPECASTTTETPPLSSTPKSSKPEKNTRAANAKK